MSDEIKAPEISQSAEKSEKTQNIKRCLTFESADLPLFISTEYVVEIINGHTITPLPLAPSYILGIINLRGQILTVMDLQAYMGKEPVVFTPQTCIIVLDIEGIQLGVVVDSVRQVTDIDLSYTKPIPVKRQQRLLNGMVTLEDGSVLMALDCPALIRE